MTIDAEQRANERRRLGGWPARLHRLQRRRWNLRASRFFAARHRCAPRTARTGIRLQGGGREGRGSRFDWPILLQGEVNDDVVKREALHVLDSVESARYERTTIAVVIAKVLLRSPALRPAILTNGGARAHRGAKEVRRMKLRAYKLASNG